MFRQSIKKAAPWLIHGIRAARWTKHQFQFPIVASVVEWRAGGRVIGGPFKGLRAPGTGTGKGYFNMLLGTYESSLIPVIQSVIQRRPATIVDAGAGWGYYALGLALKCPRTRVIAYEMDRTRADLVRKYANANGLDGQVDVRGECTAQRMETDLAGASDPFLLMDIEGTEDVLLDPANAPSLLRTEMLVELHDAFVPGVTGRIRERFAQTHNQTVFQAERPVLDRDVVGWVVDYPVLNRIVDRMVDEGRDTVTTWIHLVPQPAAGAST